MKLGYFAAIGIGVTALSEVSKAMADGKIEKGEWIDGIFAVADKSSECLLGIDLEAFRPVAAVVKEQLQAGHWSLVGLLSGIVEAMQAQSLDYQIKPTDGDVGKQA